MDISNKQKVVDLIANAKRELQPLGKKAEKLQKLSDFLLDRMPKEGDPCASMDSQH